MVDLGISQKPYVSEMFSDISMACLFPGPKAKSPRVCILITVIHIPGFIESTILQMDIMEVKRHKGLDQVHSATR